MCGSTDEAYVVRGSMDAEYFLALFELIHRDVTAGKRIYDGRAAPFRLDEWWKKPPPPASCFSAA